MKVVGARIGKPMMIEIGLWKPQLTTRMSCTASLKAPSLTYLLRGKPTSHPLLSLALSCESQPDLVDQGRRTTAPCHEIQVSPFKDTICHDPSTIMQFRTIQFLEGKPEAT